MRLLICGFHNSVVDDIAIWYEIVQNVYRTHNKTPPPRDEFLLEYGLHGRWPHYRRDAIPLDSLELEAELSDQYAKHAMEVELFPYVFSTCLKLKERGVRIGIVTHQRQASVFSILKRTGLRQVFKDAGYILCDIPIHEKSEAILSICGSVLLEHARDCLYLGDSPFGLRQAGKAGVTTVGFMNDRIPPYLTRAAEPELEVSFFDELLDILTAQMTTTENVAGRMGECPSCGKHEPLTKHHVMPAIARDSHDHLTKEQRRHTVGLCWPCHKSIHDVIKREGGHSVARSIDYYIRKVEEKICRNGTKDDSLRRIYGIV